MKSHCDNCNWKGTPKIGLEQIPNLNKRLDDGSVVPSGECPKCGALCYLLPKRTKKPYIAVAVKDAGPEVRIRQGGKWHTVCDCYYTTALGDGVQTARKIAELFNQ